MKVVRKIEMKFISHLHHKCFRRHEDGQSLILFILILFLVIAAAIGAIDIGTYIRARQRLEITADAAVLAGGLELPTSGVNATSMAWQYININDPDVDFDDVTTSFRCLVGDRNHNGYPDPEDIPAVCDPGVSASFTCQDGLCMSDCEFTGDNTCNVMALTASKDVPLIFTSVLGLPPVVITASRTGSCKGFCGEAPNVPLDVIIILDRTGSMSSYDLANAKAGALAVLELFDPELQHVGLAVLGAGKPNNPCRDKDPDRGGIWLVVPLSDDYQKEDGSLDPSSELVSTIECLATSSQGTNLGSPLSDGEFYQPDALSELLDSGRDVKKGIILMTDGAANEPTRNSCRFANEMADIVKDEDIEIFTIGYGIESERCGDRSGTYRNVRVTELLADMATDSLDDHGHCRYQSAIDAENADGDHFMCQPKGGDLELVFRAAAAALSTDIKLIQYPED
jgi:hypothetical protein